MKKILIFTCLISFHLFVHGQTFQYYYGNIHSHTGYSDGSKDSAQSGMSSPILAYNFAKNSLHMDFLGISEHNHTGAGMRLSNYAKGLAQANAANSDNNFVAMYGMEWGVIDSAGHVIIYGYDKLIGWEPGSYDEFNAKHDYKGLFAKLANKPGAFAYLAHPTDSDYSSIIARPYNVVSDQAITGMAMRSGPAFSLTKDYTEPSTSSFESYFQKLLMKGYHVAPGIDHDNHYTTFGRTAKSRLVVMAPSLTRANILDAFAKRRFFASDDWDAQVNFTLLGQVMGSIVIKDTLPAIQVQVNDPGETIKAIKLYFGVPGSGLPPTVIASTGANVSTLNYTPAALPYNGSYYYYASIKETDNDMIYTAPIWFTKGTVDVEEKENKVKSFTIYPNPSSQAVHLSYTLTKSTNVSFEIFDASGKKSACLQENILQGPGEYQMNIDRDELLLVDGIYMVRMLSDGKENIQKMIFLH